MCDQRSESEIVQEWLDLCASAKAVGVELTLTRNAGLFECKYALGSLDAVFHAATLAEVRECFMKTATGGGAPLGKDYSLRLAGSTATQPLKPPAGGEHRFRWPHRITHNSQAGTLTAAQALAAYMKAGKDNPLMLPALADALFRYGLTWDQQARLLEELGWQRISGGGGKDGVEGSDAQAFPQKPPTT
jgi:hypothetical protein